MKRPLHFICFILASIPFLISLDVYAQQNESEQLEVESYQPPIPDKPQLPRFSMATLKKGQEGWVKLNFMIDTEGKTYDIYVTEHVGNDALVDEAIKSIEKATYTPARKGGEVVDSSSSRIYRLSISEGKKNRNFEKEYENFVSALQNNSQAETEEALNKLESIKINRLYEYAYLNLVRSYYEERYGTSFEQMKYLKKALGDNYPNPQQESYLGEELAPMERRRLAATQIKNQYFSEAFDTLELMQAKGDEEGVALFSETVNQLTEFRESNANYDVSGIIDDKGYWNISLFKKSFYFDNLTGTVEELKLHCVDKYVVFDFNQELQYSVSDSVRDCLLIVVGDSGTTFTLVQK